MIEAGPRTLPIVNKAVGDFISMVVWRKPGCLADFSTVGVYDRGSLIAGVAYHNWHPEHGVIEMTAGATSARWLVRPVLDRIFAFPFDGLGCQMVVLRVSERNARMIGIAQRFGFDEYRIPRLRGRDEAEIIFTLTDTAWREIGSRRKELRHGKIGSQAA